MRTVLCKLVAKVEDVGGYINYVFEVLEEDEIKRLDTRYILATRYPNWNHRAIDINEIGFLNFQEVRAGVDSWFDGKELIPYRYDDIRFIKFITKKEDKHEYIMLIIFKN